MPFLPADAETLFKRSLDWEVDLYGDGEVILPMWELSAMKGRKVTYAFIHWIGGGRKGDTALQCADDILRLFFVLSVRYSDGSEMPEDVAEELFYKALERSPENAKRLKDLLEEHMEALTSYREYLSAFEDALKLAKGELTEEEAGDETKVPFPASE